MCQHFLSISSTFEQYRDNTDNRDNLGHYNRENNFYTITSLIYIYTFINYFYLIILNILNYK